jgi:hypothetical protein
MRAVARDYFARAGWAGLSLLVASASGVVTGMRDLEGAAIAPWIRSVVLLGSLACLAAIAHGASRTVARIADKQEGATGSLLRKQAVGPPRRWAMWMATMSTACVVAYLMNEHRSFTLTLADLPACLVNVVVVIAGIGLVTPYLRDLSAGKRTRAWPWSGSVASNRDIQEDVDIIGAISRMSPPLLFAMFLALMMFVATFTVGVYEPVKLLGGFGVVGFFVAGLLAAPALLRAQGESIDAAWRSRWYDAQQRVVARLRVFTVYIHEIMVMVQIAILGVVLGAATSGSYLASREIGSLTVAATLVAILGFVLSHSLWIWRPHQPNEEPIVTDALDSYEHVLMRLAGWALVVGSLCSLIAVLIT